MRSERSASVEDIYRVESRRTDKGIVIVTPHDDVEFDGDHHRLVQVVVNLLSNVIKFSPDGGKVEISSRLEEEWLHFAVSDQGRGVPESHRQSIFERFSQVEVGDAVEKGGSGLGLPICKAFVQAHGGTIGVDAADGGGSVFWLRRPRKRG